MLASFAGGNAHLLIGLLVASGVLSVMAMTVGYVAIQALLPPGRRGMGTGIAHAMTNLASAAAPTLVAAVSTRLTAGPGALGTAVAILTVLTFALTAALYASVAIALRRRKAAPAVAPQAVEAPAR